MFVCSRTTHRDRPYRPGLTPDQISETLRRTSAKGHVDARLVELLFDHFNDVTDHVKGEQVAAREFYQNRFTGASGAVTAERSSGA
jgi:HD-GYP domain-containing protein (c-di-GMP phosphodiesterase class II)